MKRDYEAELRAIQGKMSKDARDQYGNVVDADHPHAQLAATEGLEKVRRLLGFDGNFYVVPSDGYMCYIPSHSIKSFEVDRGGVYIAFANGEYGDTMESNSVFAAAYRFALGYDMWFGEYHEAG